MSTAINGFFGSHRFLSNFWPAWVKAADGVELPTVEHAYQYEKFLGAWTTLNEPRIKIKNAESPGDAKAIANKHKKLIASDWNDRKLHVMRRLLAQKFAVGSALAMQLKDTGDAQLIETNNWHDTFWGVCHGKGENWLGRLLMEIRSEL